MSHSPEVLSRVVASHEPTRMRRRKNVWTCPTCDTSALADFKKFPVLRTSRLVCYGGGVGSTTQYLRPTIITIRRKLSEPPIEINLQEPCLKEGGCRLGEQDASVGAAKQDEAESAAAIIPIEREEITTSIREMNSETLGTFVRDGVIGVAQKLVELKPYIEELWRRLDRGEVILGCSTKKEFCQQVLQRTPRAVRYMLDGGNHNRGETVSPSKPVPEPQPAADIPLTVKELMDWYDTADNEDIGQISFHRRRWAKGKAPVQDLADTVDATFCAIDPTTAKKLAECFLRLRKTQEVRELINWFRKRVDFPEFEFVLVNEDRLLKHGSLSKHGEVRYPRGRLPRMTLFRTGWNEETVIHELAHLLTPPPKKRTVITTFDANGVPRFRWKPVLSHGTKFKAAQRKLWDLWLRRSAPNRPACPKVSD